MLVRWERHGPGEHQTHAARVIEILTEPCRGDMIVQRKTRVEYDSYNERQGMRPLWQMAHAVGRGAASPRAHSDKTPSKPRYRFTPTLSDPRTATRIDACARSFRARLYRSARVARTRSAAIGTEVQRFLEARRKRLAQNHHR